MDQNNTTISQLKEKEGRTSFRQSLKIPTPPPPCLKQQQQQQQQPHTKSVSKNPYQETSEF